MKHTINLLSSFLVFIFLSLSISLKAIPADPRPFKVMQPSGEKITLRGFGDEYFHGVKTLDGFTVLQDNKGHYTYAVQDLEGNLVPSSVIVRDIEKRTPDDLSFLELNKGRIKDRQTSLRRTPSIRKDENAKHRLVRTKAPAKTFKGLVILVQFSDTKFTPTLDVKTIFNNQLTQSGYNYNGATGCVKDYFKDCSMGSFIPELILAGPVTLPKSTAYFGKNDDAKAPEMVTAACKLLDKDINFADYDLDKDGKVDMIYIIYAGYAESQNSTISSLIWPHEYSVENYNVVLDGVKLANYGCSSELDGIYGEETKVLAGIGAVCHEFSHVIGLPDMYDTDYEESGGQALDPGLWSVMSLGSYLNDSKTPPSYSAYERKLVGWLTPEEITTGGEFRLPAINTSNKAYYINAKTPNEAFYIENRQQTGWDTYLPGHGMMIYRVETTNPTIWENNEVNVDPSHMYYELLRADNNTNDDEGNPFPGTYGVTTLSDNTKPCLKTHAGVPTQKNISNINESADGVLSFLVNSIKASNVTNLIKQDYYMRDGRLYFIGDSDHQFIEVYDSLGRQISKQKMVLGLNEVTFDKIGLHFVKANNLFIKIGR